MAKITTPRNGLVINDAKQPHFALLVDSVFEFADSYVTGNGDSIVNAVRQAAADVKEQYPYFRLTPTAKQAIYDRLQY